MSCIPHTISVAQYTTEFQEQIAHVLNGIENMDTTNITNIVTEYTMDNCFNCIDRSESKPALRRGYPWFCVTKAKYNTPPCWQTFQITLCDQCHNIARSVDIRGWDWWDAYDCLSYSLEREYETEETEENEYNEYDDDYVNDYYDDHNENEYYDNEGNSEDENLDENLDDTKEKQA